MELKILWSESSVRVRSPRPAIENEGVPGYEADETRSIDGLTATFDSHWLSDLSLR